MRLSGGALLRHDGAPPLELPCPRERADELAAVRGWLRANHPRVEACDHALAEPVDGGAAIARAQARIRTAGQDPI
jgi:hypothetical protein